MLTELDPRVAAHVNAHAVLGALPVLAAHVPDARDVLAGLTRPTAVILKAPGVAPAAYTFTDKAIAPGAASGARRVTLLFTSPDHLNRMIAGSAQPIPVASPAGLRFLTGAFTRLADLLGRYLRPAANDLEDPSVREASTVMTLHVAAAAIAQVANEDRSGRFSAAHVPDGEVALEVGDDIDLRLLVARGRFTFIGAGAEEPARATLRFADLDVAGDVLSGRASALSSICDGTLGMRGYIPMLDNVSRILDRVGHYLGD
ncbi:hypothetical protein [Demequina capsici]|uniref:SCP2 domain-containing protein n=1 Tax=Demequina capsici TaxID=3075620 RepID=A0AA96FAM2_9MICO|nr:hypothetical protein [Demequina sp. OYTSA14]WNM25832.1 hypothetical protein RN606_06695 [Demequina sp. OYTSA14]